MGFIKSIGKVIKEFILNIIRSITKALRDIAMIIGKFFAKLVHWLKRCLEYVERHLDKLGLTPKVVGTSTYLHKTNEGFEEIAYNYSEQNGEWRRDTVIKDEIVSEDEIPDDILESAINMKNDEYINISDQTSNRVEQNRTALLA
ncbi:hypothetical protein [Ruminococcus sp.]|uniref:hypothetical protein n=1 Tax=Ruminococcus sp. TaxID=41978 RepID=UPI0025D6763B|nr:hypothetical protein [Ruminococcus sp.]